MIVTVECGAKASLSTSVLMRPERQPHSILAIARPIPRVFGNDRMNTVFKSPYMTSVTRAHVGGKRLQDCHPSPVNRKALERPSRIAFAKARKEEAK